MGKCMINSRRGSSNGSGSRIWGSLLDVMKGNVVSLSDNKKRNNNDYVCQLLRLAKIVNNWVKEEAT